MQAKLTISISTAVEADSLEEAIKIGEQRRDVLHAVFEQPDINEHWVAEEFDGVPSNVRCGDQ